MHETYIQAHLKCLTLYGLVTLWHLNQFYLITSLTNSGNLGCLLLHILLGICWLWWNSVHLLLFSFIYAFHYSPPIPYNSFKVKTILKLTDQLLWLLSLNPLKEKQDENKGKLLDMILVYRNLAKLVTTAPHPLPGLYRKKSTWKSIHHCCVANVSELPRLMLFLKKTQNKVDQFHSRYAGFLSGFTSIITIIERIL